MMADIRKSKASLTLVAAAAMSLTATGCTSLDVRKFDGSAEARKGIAYFLPFTQFETTVTWAASCDKDTDEISIAPKIEANPVTGPDPSGLYVIDYQSLSAFTKTSSVKVEFYDSGAIKSINAAADDRTGEIITAALVAAGKIAKTLAPAGMDKVTCSAGLKTALGKIAKLKDDVDQKAGELKMATDTLTALSARMTREGGSVTDKLRNQHSKQIGAVTALQIELDSLKADLAEELKGATHVGKFTFPSTSAEMAAKSGLVIPAGVLKKWVSVKKDETPEQFTTRLKGFAGEHSIWADLATDPAFHAVTGGGDGQPGDGIRYRIAVPAKLSFCRTASCVAKDATPATPQSADVPTLGTAPAKTPELIKTFPVKVLQQGTTFFLPFRSKAFTNGSLTATFSEGGVMTSAGYEQKRSAGETLANIGGTLADQIVAVTEAADKQKKTELEKLKEKVDIAKARKDLADAEAALVQADPDPNKETIAALASDTSLKKAELENRNAEIALLEARAKLAELGERP